MIDFYDVLGISRQAEDAEIARAYRRSSMAYNPDIYLNNLSSVERVGSHQKHDVELKRLEQKFKLASQAYVVLSDPNVRAIYDVYGEDGVRHGGSGGVAAYTPGMFSADGNGASSTASTAKGNDAQSGASSYSYKTLQGIHSGASKFAGLDLDEVDPHEVFRRFFGVDNPFLAVVGSNGGGDSVRGTQHYFFSAQGQPVSSAALPAPEPVNVNLSVTLEDVCDGAVRRISWTRTCAGGTQTPNGGTSGDEEIATADVTVPKGAATGDQVVLSQHGHIRQGFRPGDVVVTFNVVPHPRFLRDGDDLVVRIPVTIADALCGVSVKVPTIDGRQLDVEINEVIHPTYRHRIAGEGLPCKSSNPAHAATYSSPDELDRRQRGDLVVECNTAFPAYLTREQKVELRRILEAAPQ